MASFYYIFDFSLIDNNKKLHHIRVFDNKKSTTYRLTKLGDTHICTVLFGDPCSYCIFYFFCKIDEFPHYQSENFANSKGCKFHQLFCKYSKQRVRKLMNLAGQIIILKKWHAGLRGSKKCYFPWS